MHSDIHAFEWDPFNSNKLIVGCDGGMFRSLDGGLNYSAINKGFNATQPYAIGFERYPALGVSDLHVEIKIMERLMYQARLMEQKVLIRLVVEMEIF